MDGHGHVIIAMAMALELEAALKRKRRNKRRMEKLLRAHQVELREKWREREMLLRKNKDMLAEEADNKKLLDDFLVFTEAIGKNDAEIAKNFDEKAMMNAILPLVNRDGGDGGISGGFAGGDNVPKIEMDLEEKANMDATVAMIDSYGSAGRDNEGGTNNGPDNAQNPGQEATKGTNSDDSEG